MIPYWIGVLIFFILFLVIIFLFINTKKMQKYQEIINYILITIILSSYLITLLIYYHGAADIEKYNFHHGLPFSNISPFLFCFCFCTLLLKQPLSKVFKGIYSYLSIGLFVAMIVLPIIGHSINGVPHFMTESIFDCLSHGFSALLGIWFIISKQVDLNIRSMIKSLICMFTIILLMIIFNICFDMNNFGMSPYKDWNIYSFISFESYYLTLLTYLCCITIVMFVSYFVLKCLKKILLHMETM